MRKQIRLLKPYIIAMSCILSGVAVNIWGYYLFSNSRLPPLTELNEQGMFGLLNLFLGLGIVIIAVSNAFREYKCKKMPSPITENSTCPNCNADLNNFTSLKWKSWTVSLCAACGAHLKASRLVGGLAFLIGVGIGLFTALPMITGKVSCGHWVFGVILLIFGPAMGFWLLSNCNRYEILEKTKNE